MSRALYPVLHYRDVATTERMVAEVAAAGCAGMWLINMEGPSRPVRRLRASLAQQFPDVWLGLNALDLEPAEALRAASEEGFDGVWIDNPGLHTTHPAPAHVEALASEWATVHLARPTFRCWASVAFKTQRPEPDPVRQALAAAAHGWTPTTSGPATGAAPSVAHVATMRQGLPPEVRLAVASGLSPENAPLFLQHVDDWFVATSIAATFHTFDPVRLRWLQQQMSDAPQTAAP